MNRFVSLLSSASFVLACAAPGLAAGPVIKVDPVADFLEAKAEQPRATEVHRTSPTQSSQWSDVKALESDSPPAGLFQGFSEGFDGISLLTEQGWHFRNNSSPTGVNTWGQGDNWGFFEAYTGHPESNVMVDYRSTSGLGTISDWMITPRVRLSNGDRFSFWTRTLPGSAYPDRLELRLSLAGISTDAGTLAEDVGDFTTLLLTVNPFQVPGGYPEQWTRYEIELNGMPNNATGRFAFRYYVADAGPSGSNGNLVAIDSMHYSGSDGAVHWLSTTVGNSPSTCSNQQFITLPWLSEAHFCFSIDNLGSVPLRYHYLREWSPLLSGFDYLVDPGQEQQYFPLSINAPAQVRAEWTATSHPNGYVAAETPHLWEDISATGMQLFLSDDQITGPISLGFEFDFFARREDAVRISSNGFLSFDLGSGNGCCTGAALPSQDVWNGIIAGWWEDLNPPQGGSIHYETRGSAPNRVFIVQFLDVQLFASPLTVSMQFKLFEGSRIVEVHYASAPSDGGTFSAGIENWDGTMGVQHYLGTGALLTPSAVRYTAGAISTHRSTATAFVTFSIFDSGFE